ncbi:hypothetical protein GXW83_24630 [Streptacidiphilus sp. PB12-B1b]|uniref:hypothetical protein n=1 Tax=Streptacidiphilus sp. PB12-B1b TaxID=2705012 RepID=UPI0015F84609|nr:hypothetical protein [Streptacidiphilus sp. PB12-B1b]QMU78417.1 hypothetical protein GXW83_24630 [Streptacidiphilus sp. PB12-B1b]
MRTTTFVKRAAAGLTAFLAAAAVSLVAAAPAQAEGTTYYVNNATGSGCSDSGPGTITVPWCTFTPANALTFGPGDELLLASGDTWDQQLTLHGAGSAADHAVLSSYGTGARPKILRDGSASEMAIDAEDPSYFDYSNLELGDAGIGLRVYLTTLGHAGLNFSNISVHDNTGWAFSKANSQCLSTNRMFVPTGIGITGDLPAFSSSDYALDGVNFTDITGTRNVDSVSLEMCNGIASTANGLSWTYNGTALTSDGQDDFTLIRNVVMRGLNLSGDDGPGSGSCPDSLRINDSENVLIIDSSLNNEASCATSTGTAAVILQRTHNVRFVNDTLTNTPATGSTDQTAIDFEKHNTDDKIDHDYIAGNAGPGIELLAIHGADDQDNGQVIQSNLFADNGTATANYTGSVDINGSGFTQTATVQGNLFDEPSGGLLATGGSASGSGVTATQNQDVNSETNAAASFSSTQGSGNWSYEYSADSGSTWSPLSWDATLDQWDTGAASPAVSQFDQLPAACATCLVARTWTAPATGTVSIRADALAVQAGGDGTTVGVQLNQNPLVAASTVTTSAESPVSLDAVSVAAGDKIRFEVGAGAAANNTDDLTSFDPSIAYTQASALGDTSFELPTLHHSSYNYSATGSPWTFGNQTGISSAGSAFGNMAPDGTQVAFVQGAVAGSCMTQSVSGLTVGSSYSFTVSAAQRSGTEGGQSIAATLGGASLGSITPSSTTFADVATGSATATASTETLSFCGTVLGDHTAFIDNVRQNTPIIADPGFESPSLTTYSYGPVISGSAWTFGGNAGIEHNGSAFGAANAPQGTQAAFLQNTGGCIQRAVSGWTAGAHSVTMQVAARAGSLGGQTLQVFLDSVSLGTVTPSSTSWTSYTSGTASLTAGTHLIKICGTVSGDHTAFVDTVQPN